MRAPLTAPKAPPAFRNEAPEPLSDANVPRRVARMLEQSRAEHLALHGVSHDELRLLLQEQIEQAAGNLADMDAALRVLDKQRARTRWYEGRRRADVDRAIADRRTVREQQQDEVDRLTAELTEHPEPHAPTMWRGRDPLARLDPAAGLGRERSRQRGLARDDDLGMDLGR